MSGNAELRPPAKRGLQGDLELRNEFFGSLGTSPSPGAGHTARATQPSTTKREVGT